MVYNFPTYMRQNWDIATSSHTRWEKCVALFQKYFENYAIKILRYFMTIYKSKKYFVFQMLGYILRDFMNKSLLVDIKNPLIKNMK